MYIHVYVCVCLCVCVCVCVCVSACIKVWEMYGRASDMGSAESAYVMATVFALNSSAAAAQCAANSAGGDEGTQFTCFTSTKVQIMTQKARCGRGGGLVTLWGGRGSHWGGGGA